MAAFLKILKGPPLKEDQLHGASGHSARALSLQRLQRAAAFGALVVRDLLYGLGLLAFGRRRGKPPRMSGLPGTGGFPVGFPANPTKKRYRLAGNSNGLAGDNGFALEKWQLSGGGLY